jgi:hypothetical protein
MRLAQHQKLKIEYRRRNYAGDAAGDASGTGG